MDEKTDYSERDEDEHFRELFLAVEQPQPRAGFADRTLRAIRQETPPAGRHALVPLRKRRMRTIHWAAAGVAASAAALSVAVGIPALARACVWFVTTMVQAALWMLPFYGAGLDLLDIFARVGLALGKALATPEASMALVIVTLVGAFSFTALRRLLVSETTSGI